MKYRTSLTVLTLSLLLLGCAHSQKKIAMNLSPVEAREWLNETQGIQLVDVRTREEYAQEHILGSQLIPLQELGNRASEIDKERPILLYCHSGKRSQQAAELLKGRGFKDVHQIAGGIVAWKEKDLLVETRPAVANNPKK